MKKIPLGRNRFALVDDDDYEMLIGFKWRTCQRKSGNAYAARTTSRTQGRQLSILMHRQIIDALCGFEVDHIDGNGLNNQRFNLRCCNRSENQANIGKIQNSSKSPFKGVTRRRGRNRCEARIKVKGTLLSLGYFDRDEDAARAYDTAALEYFGKFARLNFLVVR